MTEYLKPSGDSQNHETVWQRRRRYFEHYYGSTLIIALGIFFTGIIGIPEAQRIISGDFGKITDPLELEKMMSGDFNVITNPNGHPSLENQEGGWLIDVFAISGVVSSSTMLGYGIYRRITTRDR